MIGGTVSTFPNRKDEYVKETYTPTGDAVTVKIDENEYEFNLKAGENFYFIISQQIEDETHIVKG